MIKKIVFVLLYPFAVLYNLITSIRNLLFDLKLFKSFEPDVFSVGVGNLTVGGTGKTPVTDFLISFLSENKVGVISRGYGRSTRGFIELKEASPAAEVGDEPKMLFDRHRNSTKFFVSESRVGGYLKAVSQYPETNLFIFDDVYQHRHFKPQLMILLNDYNRPFYKDSLLPAGRLREGRSGAKRADIILITKCPKFSENSEKRQIVDEIRKYASETASIYFSHFISGDPVNMNGHKLALKQKIVLISGIAQNDQFYRDVAQKYEIIHHYAYADHYQYTRDDLEKMPNEHPALPVVTTEKDFVKIRDIAPPTFLDKLYFVPLSLKIDKEEDFKSEVLTSFMNHNKIKRAF